MNAKPIFFFTFILTLILGWMALMLFPKLGLMDRPERYGHDRPPIPYPGGVVIFLVLIFAFLFLIPGSKSLTALLLGMIFLTLVNFWDDRRGLPPLFRLLAQGLAALALVAGGVGIMSLTNPFGPSFHLDQWVVQFEWHHYLVSFTVLSAIFTMLWVMMMVNAFNWIDGVPGMTSGVAVVASLILLALSLRPDFHSVDQTLAISLSAAIFGVSLGFFIFDFPPPRMLIGDTGSMLLGYVLAATAIISGGKVATLLLVMGFPILDFVWVILRRISQKKSPFKGDLWHFHHRFLKAGYSERSVVLFFVVSAALFGALSFFFSTLGKIIVFSVILLVMACIAASLYFKRA